MTVSKSFPWCICCTVLLTLTTLLNNAPKQKFVKELSFSVKPNQCSLGYRHTCSSSLHWVDQIKIPLALKYCTTWAYVAVEVQHHTFYTSVLDGVEWIQNLSRHNREKNSPHLRNLTLHLDHWLSLYWSNIGKFTFIKYHILFAIPIKDFTCCLSELIVIMPEVLYNQKCMGCFMR